MTARVTWMVLLTCLLSALISSCVKHATHGPVDSGTLRKLDRRSISRSQFEASVKSPELLASLRPAESRITLPFRMISGTPVIAVGLGPRQQMDMMIDTGAARLMLSARTVAKHAMPVVRGDEVKVTMLGVVGREQGRLGIVRPLWLGDWHVLGYPCFIRLQENHLRNTSFPDNILGFDLPSRACSYLTLDYRRNQVHFGFNTAFTTEAGKQVSSSPFFIRQGVPYVRAEAKGQSWDCLVDTGSFNGLEIDEVTAKKLGVQDQGKLVKGIYLAAVGGTLSSDAARLRTVELHTVKIFGGSYAKAEVDISPGIPRVGSFFLKDYRVTFDFRRQRLWLEW